MRKVKGYTLVETLVSLTIIVMSIGIGFTIFENFMQGTSAYKKTIARNQIDSFIFRNQYLEGAEIDNEHISFEIKESKEWPKCQLLEIIYSDNEREIYKQMLLIEKK